MPITNPAALEALVAANLRESPPSISQPVEAPHKGVSKWAQLATLAGHGADAYSTIEALKNPNAVEANPLYGQHPSAGKILGVKGGTAALQMLMQHYLGKKSPGAANALGLGTGAILGGVAAHNLSLKDK